jgi:hypothetical protein
MEYRLSYHRPAEGRVEKARQVSTGSVDPPSRLSPRWTPGRRARHLGLAPPPASSFSMSTAEDAAHHLQYTRFALLP